MLKIKCTKSNFTYLIDSGSSCSLIPASKLEKRNKPDGQLYAANGTEILVYGSRRLTVDLGLDRTYDYIFIVADVQTAIIGSDFLCAFDILVDLKGQRLLNNHSMSKAQVDNNPIIASVHAIKDAEVQALFEKYSNLTSVEPYMPGKKLEFEVEIPLRANAQVQCCRPRRMSPKMMEVLRTKLEQMLRANIIQPSKSAWGSPAHLVEKKDTDEFRFVGDFVAVNREVIPDNYSIPVLADFVNGLANKTVFSVLDIRDAFHSIPLKPSSRHITALRTVLGSYEYKVLPQGLCLSSSAFQRAVDELMRQVQWTDDKGIVHRPSVFCYIDDLIISSETRELAINDLEAVLAKLSEYNLKLNPQKCRFLADDVTFLGHNINKDGYKPSECKVQAVLDLKLPATLGELKKTIGKINWFHRFLDQGATILNPLYNMLKGYKKRQRQQRIRWADHTEASQAFENAKSKLAERTLLAFPTAEGQLVLQTDASAIAVGACLKQVQNNKEKALGFFSKKHTLPESKLSAFSQELLAVYKAVKFFHYMIGTSKLILQTDNIAIVHIFRQKNVCERSVLKETRMLLYLNQYNIEVQHIKGVENNIADMLSRNVCSITETRHTAVVTASLRDELIMAQQNCPETKQFADNTANHSIQLQLVSGLYCQEIKGRYRPYVPAILRKKIMAQLHDLSHFGVVKTTNLISERFLWQGMKKDIKKYVQCCIMCQTCKVTKHNKTQLSNFSVKYPERFAEIVIDTVGPLPLCQGFCHILTMADRFTGMQVLVPLRDLKTENVAREMFLNWVVRFGIPVVVHSDNSKSFLGKAFSRMLQNIGCNFRPTTAYSPYKVGFIEQRNKSLKAAIRAGGPDCWVETMGTYNLAYNSSVREEAGASPFQMCFGTGVRLPTDLLDEAPSLLFTEAASLPDRLRKAMLQTVPRPKRFERKENIDQNLYKCSHVFLYNEAKKNLAPFYTGPYKVAQRGDKNFGIEVDNTVITVSINRLKSAHIYDDSKNNENADLNDPIFRNNVPIFIPKFEDTSIPSINSPVVTMNNVPTTSGSSNIDASVQNSRRTNMYGVKKATVRMPNILPIVQNKIAKTIRQKQVVGSGRAGISKTPRKPTHIERPRQVWGKLTPKASIRRTTETASSLNSSRNVNKTFGKTNKNKQSSIPKPGTSNSRESICRNEQIEILGGFFDTQDDNAGAASIPNKTTKKVTKAKKAVSSKEPEPGRVVNPKTGFSYTPGVRWSTRINKSTNKK